MLVSSLKTSQSAHRSCDITHCDRRHSSLALHVGEHLGDLAVTDPYEVDASDMSLLASLVGPAVHPGEEGSIAQGDHLLGLEDRLRRRAVELFNGAPHCGPALVPLPVGWGGSFPDDVLSRQSHRGVEVAAHKRLVQSANEVDGRGRTRVLLRALHGRLPPDLTVHPQRHHTGSRTDGAPSSILQQAHFLSRKKISRLCPS